jgi:hypothetical protein
MPDIGDAYYPAGFDLIKKGVPEGRYTASVVSLDIIEDMKFGNYIADIFKPEYMVDIEEHPKVEGEIVKDNGIFRYKKVDGHLYEHKKNWGYAKFLSMMGLRNDEEKGGQLPFLYQSDVKGAKVLIDVSLKEFTNENENSVSYPVARVVQVLKKAPVPF